MGRAHSKLQHPSQRHLGGDFGAAERSHALRLPRLRRGADRRAQPAGAAAGAAGEQSRGCGVTAPFKTRAQTGRGQLISRLRHLACLLDGSASTCRHGRGAGNGTPPVVSCLAGSRIQSHTCAVGARTRAHPDVLLPWPQERTWSLCNALPVAEPVLPQPAPDPDSNVFKPEPLLHLHGQAMQHLAILKEMRTKVRGCARMHL